MSAATRQRLAFYNYDKIYSYNGVFNIIVGARGLGKSYGAKVKAVKAAVKKGDEFIYLRRHDEELKRAKDVFFADILDEFPGYHFRVNSYVAEMSETGEKGSWKVIGYFHALSQAQSMKSTPFPNVRTIIYDEFIIEKGLVQYLSNEAMKLINYYSTIDRYRDQVKVFLLANNVTINNPYFLEWKILPTETDEFIIKEDGFVVAHFPDSEEFKAGVYKTRFGKFIANSEYADYAVGNVAADNHDGLLKLKNAEARYAYSIETESGGVFSVWIDWKAPKGPEYYFQEKRPKQEILFTLSPQRMQEGKTLLFKQDKLVSILRTAFRNNKASFDTQRARNVFIEIFKR